ncbi:hypothetical protein HN011_003465 [Eciton burchellii]|nr:hypothetical protein HN011_003465 [Eciton burchellii]
MERIIYSWHVQPQVVLKRLRQPRARSAVQGAPGIDRGEIQRRFARKTNLCFGLLRLPARLSTFPALEGGRTRLDESQMDNVVH